MKESEYFSVAAARLICEQYPHTGDWDDCIDLSGYSHADPMAFEYLVSQGRRMGLELGLNQLDVQTALILLKCSSSLDFNNLDHLSREAAAVLSETVNCLSIDGLRGVEVGVISELVKHKTALFLSFADELTFEIATELAKHYHELFVTVPTQPPMHMQSALLFSYSGREVLLRFPFDRKAANTAFYRNRHRSIEVTSMADQTGQLWQDITATDDVDRWLDRLYSSKQK